MDYGFKFAIGDIVKLSVDANRESNGLMWLDYIETRYLITERLLQECPGGIQRHYVARACRANGDHYRDYGKFNEIELVASEPFPQRVRKDNSEKP